jgi:hypothetical protein
MALARRVSGAAHSERRILVAMDSNFLAPAPTMLGSQESTRPVAPVHSLVTRMQTGTSPHSGRRAPIRRRAVPVSRPSSPHANL